jgi:hypothetical protein
VEGADRVLGDEVTVDMPGICVHGRYGVWTGKTKPRVKHGRGHLPMVYEIEFFSGEIESLWLADKDLTWL